MDLAKIRKKSLLAPTERADIVFAAPPSSPELINNPHKAIPDASATTGMDFFQHEQYSSPVASIETTPQLFSVMYPEGIVAACTPLEAILAGRIAVGCDDEPIAAENGTNQLFAESCLEFLCFRIYDEIYGINIMEIKEIIKPREVTEVPRAPVFVSGILSLRGVIIPIIDMRVRLNLARNELSGKERVVVIKNNNSFSGLLVDEVIQVVKVQLDAVESAPAFLGGIDRDFISGLGRSDGRLIIILNLENVANINLY